MDDDHLYQLVHGGVADTEWCSLDYKYYFTVDDCVNYHFSVQLGQFRIHPSGDLLFKFNLDLTSFGSMLFGFDDSDFT